MTTTTNRTVATLPAAPSWVVDTAEGIHYGHMQDEPPIAFQRRIYDPQDDDTTDWSVVVDQYIQRDGDRLVAEPPHVVIYNGDEVNGSHYWRDAETLRRLIAKCQAALEVFEQAVKEHEQG